MMRGGTLCGDCREYGPPRDWHWRYDAESDRHEQMQGALAPPAAAPSKGVHDDDCWIACPHDVPPSAKETP
jgi:hypothetical protein